MAFASGSVRLRSNTIDDRVYQASMTPAGKARDVPINEYLPDEEC